MAQDSSDLHFAWFLAGTALGVAGALLLAPKSGKDTRHYLAKSTNESRESLEESRRELMESCRDLYERGRKIAEDAGDLFERGRKLVEG
jgi:gas vesicle protein